jgi:hypothetical protein
MHCANNMQIILPAHHKFWFITIYCQFSYKRERVLAQRNDLSGRKKKVALLNHFSNKMTFKPFLCNNDPQETEPGLGG